MIFAFFLANTIKKEYENVWMAGEDQQYWFNGLKINLILGFLHEFNKSAQFGLVNYGEQPRWLWNLRFWNFSVTMGIPRDLRWVGFCVFFIFCTIFSRGLNFSLQILLWISSSSSVLKYMWHKKHFGFNFGKILTLVFGDATIFWPFCKWTLDLCLIRLSSYLK